MSRLRANQITNENANGAPNFPHGLTVTGIVTASTLNTSTNQIVVGSAVTANSNGVDTIGIVTATSFKDKAGGTFAPNPTTTQGDIIVRGASANERLGIGAAGKSLIVNSAGNGLEYGNGGLLLSHDSAIKTDTQSTTTSGASFADVVGLAVTITPASSASRVFVNYSVSFGVRSSRYSGSIRLVKVIGGSTTSDFYVGDAAGSRTRASNFFWSDNANYSHNNQESMSGTLIDHPNTTNPVTYKIQFNNGYSGGHYSYINYAGESEQDNTNTFRSVSAITALELAS